MDFSPNETQLMLADSIDKFLENDYDFERRMQYAGSDLGFSAEVWQTFAELGWTAVPFSEEDGGFDGGPADLMVVMERFGRGLVVEPYLANIVLAGGILKRAASAEQKERWLTGIIGGDLQAALAFVEPQARYDLYDIATTAKADGDDWILDGSKGYVLNGRNANVILVPARTGGDRRDRDGITMFAVARDSDGLDIRDYPTVDGHQAAEIHLDGVRVPAENLLGKPGEAADVLQATLDDATLAVSAEAVGIMLAMTDKTVDYSKNRVQFGVPIGSFQALQHRMVDMLTNCEQARSLLLWATMVADAGRDDAARAISALKYKIGTTGREVGEEAVQLHGGMGVTWELDIAHYFKRLIAIGQIFGNSDWHIDRFAGRT